MQVDGVPQLLEHLKRLEVRADGVATEKND